MALPLRATYLWIKLHSRFLLITAVFKGKLWPKVLLLPSFLGETESSVVLPSHCAELDIGLPLEVLGQLCQAPRLFSENLQKNIERADFANICDMVILVVDSMLKDS